MELLESPLEALVFCYSAALASSAWAWLAILFAAALSFWRIRAVGSLPKPDLQQEPFLKASTTALKLQNFVKSTESTLQARGCHVDGGESSGTKGRFTAYFHVESDGDRNVTEDGNRDSVSDENGRTPLRCEDWIGDLGWYRYLDLTAFDGNVVRLWDHNEGFRRRP